MSANDNDRKAVIKLLDQKKAFTFLARLQMVNFIDGEPESL